jgi:hypothetical protein
VPIVLSIDPDDASVHEFKRYLKSSCLHVALRGMRDVFSFACCCDLLLSGNTELFHFAVALKVPMLGLLAADEEERWVPPETPFRRILRWRPGERVVEADFLRAADAVRRGRTESRKPVATEPDRAGSPVPVRERRAPRDVHG